MIDNKQNCQFCPPDFHIPTFFDSIGFTEAYIEPDYQLVENGGEYVIYQRR
jgi:hypothetical protein